MGLEKWTNYRMRCNHCGRFFAEGLKEVFGDLDEMYRLAKKQGWDVWFSKKIAFCPKRKNSIEMKYHFKG